MTLKLLLLPLIALILLLTEALSRDHLKVAGVLVKLAALAGLTCGIAMSVFTTISVFRLAALAMMLPSALTVVITAISGAACVVRPLMVISCKVSLA